MSERLVFGVSDPQAYAVPPCRCGHERDEHEPTDVWVEDGRGDVGLRTRDACWHDWSEDWLGGEDGCPCERYDPAPSAVRWVAG